MSAEYATMLGYTQEELEVNFSVALAEAESRQSLSHDDFMAKIKKWYDGFRFYKNAEAVLYQVTSWER